MKIISSAVLGFLLVSTFADKEPDVSNLPAAVQRTIKEWKGEGDLKKVRTRKNADGTTVYEVDYKERGDEKLIVVAADGSIISESEGKGKGKGKDKQKGKKEKAEKKQGDRDQDKEDDDRDDVEVKRTDPVIRPGSPQPPKQPSSPTGAITRATGQTRTLAWEQVPEAVRTAAAAEQAQLGNVNGSLTRMQTKPRGDILYHVTYERGTRQFNPDGTAAGAAAQGGGPMQMIEWDKLPAPVQATALLKRQQIGDVNRERLFYQAQRGKQLYHVFFHNGEVHAYSADGRVQDPATFLQ